MQTLVMKRDFPPSTSFFTRVTFCISKLTDSWSFSLSVFPMIGVLPHIVQFPLITYTIHDIGYECKYASSSNNQPKEEERKEKIKTEV